MDPFPQAVGLSKRLVLFIFVECAFGPRRLIFPPIKESAARLGPNLFKTSGFLANYGSKAHDIGGLGRNEIGGVVAGIPYSIVGARSTYSQIPCEMEEGNNCAEQGIKSAHQGSFPPDQGRPNGSDGPQSADDHLPANR